MNFIFIGGLILSCISIGAIFYRVPNASDAYLSAWSFWLQFPLGALGITLLHELTGGKWGLAAKPILKSMSRCLWLAPLLFIPLVFYHTSYFVLRSAIYFMIFLLINWRSQSLKRGPYMAGWGLFFYFVFMSFASIDWYMAREPEWHSTIYSLIWIMAQVSSAFAVILLMKFPGFPSFSHIDNQDQLNRDHGTIFFVFLVLWAYLSFMQFLIIWSGNLPNEVSWYLVRLSGSQGVMALAILLGLFVFPFILLLNRKFKTNPRALSLLAIIVLLFSYLDAAWIILPATRKQLIFSPWDLVSFLGIGGLSIWFFSKQITKALRNINDSYS